VIFLYPILVGLTQESFGPLDLLINLRYILYFSGGTIGYVLGYTLASFHIYLPRWFNGGWQVMTFNLLPLLLLGGAVYWALRRFLKISSATALWSAFVCGIVVIETLGTIVLYQYA